MLYLCLYIYMYVKTKVALPTLIVTIRIKRAGLQQGSQLCNKLSKILQL